jgi:hypothetical protein
MRNAEPIKNAFGIAFPYIVYLRTSIQNVVRVAGNMWEKNKLN